MRGSPALQRVFFAIALPLILLSLWWVMSANSENFFWPPLKDILAAFPETWFTGRMREDVLPSLSRLAVGYLLALGLGVAVGIPIGLSRRLRAFAEPTLEFFRAIPPPVIVPVIALFAGYTGSLS